MTVLLASMCVLLVQCAKEAKQESAPKNGGTVTSSPDASKSKAGACEAARKKIAECGITPAQTNLGDPCDERVAACLVGQGCEAIRKNETGCIFH